MEQKWASEFISTGNLRLGTLFDYRNTEQHGSEIGDEGEGLQTFGYVNSTAGNIDASNVMGLSQLAKFIGILADEVTIHPGGGFSGVVSCPDMYLFCVSKEINIKKMYEMRYDSCIVISNPELFFSSISTAISNIASPYDHAEVIYQDRHIILQENLETRSYLIKPDYERFVRQREYRFVWKPFSEPELPYLDIFCPEAVQYCKKII
jgi:hypothetical protein